MKNKQTKNNKYAMPLRRQSFSDFSQSYSNGLSNNKLSYGDKMRRRAAIKRVLVILGFVALFFIGYLIISVMLNISKLPPETAAIFMLI
jgi:hypothetical protein